VVTHKKTPTDEISIYGIEKIAETYKLAKMNLAVHGLASDIKAELNSYYDDPHDSVGKFDFVMANPPFNQSAVDRGRIKDDTKRYPFGMPTTDNANYLWIQLFYSSLKKDRGRAGFVMANSAADARGTELEIRRTLIETGSVDVMISLTSNLFYTVTQAVTLWFLDKRQAKANHKETVLFIDARHNFRQVDRAHREMTAEQIEFVTNIVRLYRGEESKSERGSARLMTEHFPKGKYVDVLGLCRVSTREEIEAKGHSLNPGRYVGVPERAAEDFDFKEKLEELNEQLVVLNAEAQELEAKIEEDVARLLES
jgi:type I restriction enzyme M protein